MILIAIQISRISAKIADGQATKIFLLWRQLEF
jgi:hypothetical protein